MEVRPGSETTSKAEQGCTGTRESLPSPHDETAQGESYEKHPISHGSYRLHEGSAEKTVSLVVTGLRGTEGKVMDEGSLSIYIVPTESWEISPKKAS